MDRNIEMASIEILKLCQDLGYSRDIEKKAIDIYQNAIQNKLVHDKPMIVTMTAAILVAGRKIDAKINTDIVLTKTKINENLQLKKQFEETMNILEHEKESNK